MSQIFLGYPPPKIKEFIIKNYTDWTKVPLHFVAEEANAKMSFLVLIGTYQTSTDGKNWTDYKSGTEITLANVGDKVYFKAKTTNNTCYDDTSYCSSQFSINSGKIAAKGNIQSLLDETLARTDVPPYCYMSMFQDCSALTQAPTLPVTTLAIWCYAHMFHGCSALTTVPELPATSLVSRCYFKMFQDCLALETVSFPNLSKETVASDIVVNQDTFYEAASNIEATCQDGILVINSTEA